MKLLLIKISFLLLTSAMLYSCDLLSSDSEQSEEATAQQAEDDNLVKKYYSNGNIKSESYYKDSVRHGLSKVYYIEGGLHATFQYTNGVKNGMAKWYHLNGEVYKEIPYVDDKITGLMKVYYDDKTLQAEIPYREDKPGVGTKEYAPNGNLRKRKPEIVIETEDNIAFGNKYNIRLKLSNNYKQVEFFAANLIDSSFINYYDNDFEVIPTYKGVGTFSIYLPPGKIYMDRLRFVAVTKTSLSHPLLITKTYDIAIEHPAF